MFQWVDYEIKHARMIDSWLDAEAVAMTGIDAGWDHYWLAVKADAVNFPGCEDFCKVIYADSDPFAVICFGVYQDEMTISEVVVAPRWRGMGKGSQLISELVESARTQWPREVKRITAVVFPQNRASQKAFRNAGFQLTDKTEDGVDFIFTYTLEGDKS